MTIRITKKKVIVFLLLLLLAVAIPLTVYLSQRQQETRSRAQVVPDTTTVALFNGEQITKGDVRKVAEENYSPETVDDQALKDALEILIERKILDKASAELGIVEEADRVNKYILQELSETDSKCEALREQVILKTVNSIEASSIGFWNPPTTAVSALSTQEQTTAQQQLTVGLSVLPQAKDALDRGEDILATADSLIADNPTLVSVISVNGFILANLDSQQREVVVYPQIYQFADSSLDTQTRDGLFSTAQNEVKEISGTEANRGGVVFKVISKGNPSGEGTYDNWLIKQKSALFKDLGVL